MENNPCIDNLLEMRRGRQDHGLSGDNLYRTVPDSWPWMLGWRSRTGNRRHGCTGPGDFGRRSRKRVGWIKYARL